MNRTVAFVCVTLLAATGIVGAVVLQVHRPDATATFASFVGQLLGTLVLAAGTFYGFGKTGEKLQQIEKQTNGRLTKRDEKIAEQEAELIALRRETGRPTRPRPLWPDGHPDA